MAKKLLVVDSNLAIQKLVEHHLSREAFEVTCLNDGLSALDLLAKINPDIILADYQLEGIGFTRFCEKIRQKSTTKERPIIVLISPTDGVDVNQLFSLGVVDFVKKPLEPRELIEKLSELSQDAATVIDKTPRPAAPSSPPEGPAASVPLSSEEQAEVVKIEELLGWSLPGEKPADKPAPEAEEHIPEPDNERTLIESRIDLFASEPFPPTESRRAEPEIPAAGLESNLNDSEPMTGVAPPPTTPSIVATPPSMAETAASVPPSITPASLEAAFPNLYAGPETVESPPAETVPAERPASTPESGAVSPEMIETLVSKMAREIIEKVAWDVVPALAETLIKEELERLKPEKPT